MVELYLNMQNKRKADGVIDIEIAQNPPKTRILRIEIFDSELYGNVSHSIPSKTLYKASIRYKYNRVRQRSMVELYLNMQNKRKADGVIDIEIAQNPLKTVFMTAL